MKAFLLEDNKIFREKFSNFLDKKGFSVTSYSSIQEYKFIESDIYFLDLQIGNDMSYSIIEDIMENKKAGEPIVLLTHHTNKDYISKAVGLGVSYVLPKLDYELYSIHIDLIKKNFNI